MVIVSVQVLGLSSVFLDGEFILDKPFLLSTSDYGKSTAVGYGKFATFSIVDGNLKEELSQTQILSGTFS